MFDNGFKVDNGSEDGYDVSAQSKALYALLLEILTSVKVERPSIDGTTNIKLR